MKLGCSSRTYISLNYFFVLHLLRIRTDCVKRPFCFCLDEVKWRCIHEQSHAAPLPFKEQAEVPHMDASRNPPGLAGPHDPLNCLNELGVLELPGNAEGHGQVG